MKQTSNELRKGNNIALAVSVLLIITLLLLYFLT